LLFAQKLALKFKLPLHVCFCLVPTFLDATIRHFGFMLKGLREVESECAQLGIGFHLLIGEASSSLVEFAQQRQAGAVVTDFSPLRLPRRWLDDVIKALPSDVSVCQVDAHNVVPCWVASEKQEYGARTIRRKIMDRLPEYLTEFPPVQPHPHPAPGKPEPVDWEAAEGSLQVDRTVTEVDWARPGSAAALEQLQQFCDSRLKLFATKRNDPTVAALSQLSPWLHFGQLSAQRAVLCVQRLRSRHSASVAAFVEETVVRRELADNFCYHQPHYDHVRGAHGWAGETLKVHSKDKREYLYSRDQLEAAKTHDELWNAAQLQMLQTGKMHGFLRMYWAKKVLEWTASPEEALSTAIYLNDRYSLDGRDPNGYVGCMWSICGTHDQGWAERPVFGKIRYMNYAGCRRKFDVDAFVARYGGKKHKYVPPGK